MENYSYHVPFYVVTSGVATSGHSSDLTGGQVGLFDRQNFSVATASGIGKELFFSVGAVGGKGFYGEPVTESHKSPFFLSKDVYNIYKSIPAKIQNEEWIIGYDGSASSKSLEFVKGYPTRINLYFHGEPTYRLFNGPKEYVQSYTPPLDCTDDCASDCGGTRLDPKPHAIKLINQINNFIELQKLGVKAQLVEDTFVATSVTKKQWTLTKQDGGTDVDLGKVAAQYPGLVVTRKSYDAFTVTSVYIVTKLSSEPSPTAYVSDGSKLSLTQCGGTCPSGWTTISGEDVYFVSRPLAGTEDLTTSNAQQTYADTIKTDYSADSAQFLGYTESSAKVKISVHIGTSVENISADQVIFEYTLPAMCKSPVGSSITWVVGSTGISGTRTATIKLKRPDCNATGDRISDIQNALTGVLSSADIATLAKTTGDACFDDYAVTQTSDDFLSEDCLTSNVTFTFNTPLPLIDGKEWIIQDPSISPNNARKVGIRISAGYYDPKFGNCSFDPTDYYENMPLKFELSQLDENADNCAYAAKPTVVQTKIAKIARQSGEWVIRETLLKAEAYLKHVDQWDINPRMREAFNMQLQNTVDRNASYVLWYVTFGASYNATSRKNEKEKFTAVFAFKEDDPALLDFEKNIIGVVSAKSGVVPHVNP